jgi:RimJ/RimL family protein N-acetyltransferase
MKLEKINSVNKKYAHNIFPGEVGKYWVDFNWYWGEISFRRSFINSQFIYLNENPAPIGFVSYGQHFRDRILKECVPNSYELYHMVIDERMQGQGLGKAATIYVLQEIAKLEAANKLIVACHPDNKRATKLYNSLGFKFFSKNYDDDPMYFITPETALKMQMPIHSFKTNLNPISKNAKAWTEESYHSEKSFSWDDWELGLD